MKDGRLPDDLEVRRIGRIFYVRSKAALAAEAAPSTVLYARVSSSEQATDLVCQVERLQRHAREQGWVVSETVMETTSGRRVKLLRVLNMQGPLRVVVERSDRLMRSQSDLSMIDASLRGRGGQVVEAVHPNDPPATAAVATLIVSPIPQVPSPPANPTDAPGHRAWSTAAHEASTPPR